MSGRAIFILLALAMLCISGTITTCVVQPDPPETRIIIPVERQAEAAEMITKLIESQKDDKNFRADYIFQLASETALKVYGQPYVESPAP